MNCEGCGRPLNPVEATQWSVCWGCTRARAATVGRGGRCACPKTKRRERTIVTRSRSWVGCDRCLGAVRNLT